MRLFLLYVGAACASAWGCATAPPPVPSEVALMLTPRPEEGCDFERPDREIALAISTDRTEPIVRNRGSGQPTTSTYMVRNAQLMRQPTAGDQLCLTVLRGPTMRHKVAVYGFDVRFLDPFQAEITPAYSRLDQPLFGQRGAGDVNVSVAFVAGRQTATERQLSAGASFDLGPVARPGTRRSGQAAILDLPEARTTSTTRLGVIVREAGAGQSSVIPADLMEQALTDGVRPD